jgi:hypothetical protein
MGKRVIKRITYKDEYENPQEATVGKSNVVETIEHSAVGEGDKWYYDIVFEGGDTFRVFTPVFVASTQEPYSFNF